LKLEIQYEYDILKILIITSLYECEVYLLSQ